MFNRLMRGIKPVFAILLLISLAGCVTTGPDKAHDPANFVADSGKAVVIIGIDNDNLMDFKLGWRSLTSMKAKYPEMSLSENIERFKLDRLPKDVERLELVQPRTQKLFSSEPSPRRGLHYYARMVDPGRFSLTDVHVEQTGWGCGARTHAIYPGTLSQGSAPFVVEASDLLYIGDVRLRANLVDCHLTGYNRKPSVTVQFKQGDVQKAFDWFRKEYPAVSGEEKSRDIGITLRMFPERQ